MCVVGGRKEKNVVEKEDVKAPRERSVGGPLWVFQRRPCLVFVGECEEERALSAKETKSKKWWCLFAAFVVLFLWGVFAQGSILVGREKISLNFPRPVGCETWLEGRRRPARKRNPSV